MIIYVVGYLVFYGALGSWVGFDAYRRRAGLMTGLWVLAAILAGPIVLPLYFAKRPLLNDEQRIGGFGWNLLRNFAITWTLLLSVWIVPELFVVGNLMSASHTGAESADLRIETLNALLEYGGIWFLPTVGALFFGYLLKDNSVIETKSLG